MATVSFEYKCDVAAGFVMDPNEQKRFGYVTAFSGIGLPEGLAADLNVSVPYNTGDTPTFAVPITYTRAQGSPVGVATVVGVIDTFKWSGGACDPIKLEFFVSQHNAMQILSILQRALKTPEIKKLGWWIADYDQETKKWFQQAHPSTNGGGITGHLNCKNDEGAMLAVDLKHELVKEGVDVNVYKVTLEVVPAGKFKYRLHFASTHGQPMVRSWGILIDQS
jgi:hypothetical protein